MCGRVGTWGRGLLLPLTSRLLYLGHAAGTAKYAQDEAYEEAAYLMTNRFLAAYVVDEQSRASYVNDLLNEGFHHVRVKVIAYWAQWCSVTGTVAISGSNSRNSG